MIQKKVIKSACLIMALITMSCGNSVTLLADARDPDTVDINKQQSTTVSKNQKFTVNFGNADQMAQESSESNGNSGGSGGTVSEKKALHDEIIGDAKYNISKLSYPGSPHYVYEDKFTRILTKKTAVGNEKILEWVDALEEVGVLKPSRITVSKDETYYVDVPVEIPHDPEPYDYEYNPHPHECDKSCPEDCPREGQTEWDTKKVPYTRTTYGDMWVFDDDTDYVQKRRLSNAVRNLPITWMYPGVAHTRISTLVPGADGWEDVKEFIKAASEEGIDLHVTDLYEKILTDETENVKITIKPLDEYIYYLYKIEKDGREHLVNMFYSTEFKIPVVIGEDGEYRLECYQKWLEGYATEYHYEYRYFRYIEETRTLLAIDTSYGYDTLDPDPEHANVYFTEADKRHVVDNPFFDILTNGTYGDPITTETSRYNTTTLHDVMEVLKPYPDESKYKLTIYVKDGQNLVPGDTTFYTEQIE